MSKQTKLKNKLLQGTISNFDFLQNLMKLDQSTPERDNCFENIDVLEDGEIKKIFDTADQQTKYTYYDYLRLF